MHVLSRSRAHHGAQPPRRLAALWCAIGPVPSPRSRPRSRSALCSWFSQSSPALRPPQLYVACRMGISKDRVAQHAGDCFQGAPISGTRKGGAPRATEFICVSYGILEEIDEEILRWPALHHPVALSSPLGPGSPLFERAVLR